MKLAPTNLPAEQVIKDVIRLQETKKAVDSRLKYLRQQLLDKMKDMDVRKLETGSYILNRVEKATIKVTDDQKVKEQLEKAGHQVITKEVIDMKYMKPLIEDNLEGLEGVEIVKVEYPYIKVREQK